MAAGRILRFAFPAAAAGVAVTITITIAIRTGTAGIVRLLLRAPPMMASGTIAIWVRAMLARFW
jgi:hypothetical protein